MKILTDMQKQALMKARLYPEGGLFTSSELGVSGSTCAALSYYTDKRPNLFAYARNAPSHDNYVAIYSLNAFGREVADALFYSRPLPL